MYRQRSLVIRCKAQHNKSKIASKKSEIERYTKRMDEIIETYSAATSKMTTFSKQFDFILTKLNSNTMNNNNESILYKFGQSLNKMLNLVCMFNKEYSLFVARIIDGSNMPTSFSINHHIWAYELFIAWLTREQQIIVQNGNLHNIQNGKTRMKKLQHSKYGTNIKISKTKQNIKKKRNKNKNNNKNKYKKCVMCNHSRCRCCGTGISGMRFEKNTSNNNCNKSFVDLFNGSLNNLTKDLNELLNNFDVFFNDSLMLTTTTTTMTTTTDMQDTNSDCSSMSSRDSISSNDSDSLLHSLKTVENVQLITKIYETHNAMIDFQNDIIELKNTLDNKIYQRLSVFQTQLTFNFKKQIIVAKVNINGREHRHTSTRSKTRNKNTSKKKRKINGDTDTPHTPTITSSVQVVKKIGDFNGIGKILKLLNNA